MDPRDPRHGTNVGYSYGKCRCTPCQRAHTRAVTLWRMGRTDSLIDATGTHRRIEALMTLGWSRADLSQRLGHQRDYFAKMIGQPTVTGRVAAKIARLYDELSMTPAPDSSVTRRTRAFARRKGFAPPLAWDDIDDPNERPNTGVDRWRHTRDADVDPVVVTRILAGDWRLPCTAAEKAAVVAAWDGSHNELARRTGWKIERYVSREDVA